jgi:hypothetical protein
MKSCLSVLALVFSFNAISQSLCGTTDENGSITLTAPPGNVFTAVTFASYGTPNGSCGSFTIGSCHAAGSQAIVENALIGNNSGTINANNGVFGDPCNGTFKRLYIQASYSTSLPLRLLSFSCINSNRSNILQWQTDNEINTMAFNVERSTDGIGFSSVASISSANNNGTNLYSYTDNSVSGLVCFYRLKMIDQNGSFTYSNIIKAKTGSNVSLEVFPNPVTDLITISGLHATGYVEITTLQGTLLERIAITNNTQAINMSRYIPGMYMLKYTTGKITFYQKLVKQ